MCVTMNCAPSPSTYWLLARARPGARERRLHLRDVDQASCSLARAWIDPSLGFGRIVVSEKEVPSMLVYLV
jgi:hypothetical protein